MSQIFSPKSIEDSFKRLTSEDERSRKRCQRYEVDETDATDNNHQDGRLLSDEHKDERDETLAQAMKQAHVRRDLDSQDCLKKRVDFRRICSICLGDGRQVDGTSDEGQANGQDLLIRPCLCVGNRSYQHKRCIEEWIESTGAVSCPFCQVHYDFVRKKKSFWTYIRDCACLNDCLVNIAALTFSLYLLLIGSAVCYNYGFATYRCNPTLSSIDLHSAKPPRLNFASMDWSDLEGLVDCYRFAKQLHQVQSWSGLLLFCIVCILTITLFIGIISLGLNMVIQNYAKYSLWSESNFEVRVRPYLLQPKSTRIPTETTT